LYLAELAKKHRMKLATLDSRILHRPLKLFLEAQFALASP
jgi:hypothetical protein